MENPKTILITGASSGIGAALSLFYAAPDVALFLTGRNQDRLEEVAGQCRAKGADVMVGIVDVCDREAMARFIIKIDTGRALDLVIANAGVSGGTGGCDAAEPAEQVREIFDINVTGVLNTIDPVLPTMIKRGRGQIALMSSLASFSSWPGAPAYSASKAAIRVYGEALKGALLGTGVEVSVICPGFIRTPMTDVNGYKMPLMIEGDAAARIIAAGLTKGRTRIAFPFRSYVIAGFLGMWPIDLVLKILKKLPEKPSSDRKN